MSKSRSNPNNFPREGDHNAVTRDAVDKLEAERPALNAETHYTIGGTVETVVHSSLDAEREAAITTGSRRLQQAANDLRRAFANPARDARSEYVREQQAVAAQGRSRQPDKIPSR